jgi:hypothetical protein
MLDNAMGSIIFEIIGAFVKWVLFAIVNSIQGKKTMEFKEILGGSNRANKSDLPLYGVSNVILGLLTVIALGFLINAMWFK